MDAEELEWCRSITPKLGHIGGDPFIHVVVFVRLAHEDVMDARVDFLRGEISDSDKERIQKFVEGRRDTIAQMVAMLDAADTTPAGERKGAQSAMTRLPFGLKQDFSDTHGLFKNTIFYHLDWPDIYGEPD
jgi:hypothetical protein